MGLGVLEDRVLSNQYRVPTAQHRADCSCCWETFVRYEKRGQEEDQEEAGALASSPGAVPCLLFDHLGVTGLHFS